MELSEERKQGIRNLVEKRALVERLFKEHMAGDLKEKEFRLYINNCLDSSNAFKTFNLLFSCSGEQLEEVRSELNLSGDFPDFINGLCNIDFRVPARISRLNEEEDGFYNAITRITSRPFFLTRPKVPAIRVEFKSIESDVLLTSVMNIANFAGFAEITLRALDLALNQYAESNIQSTEEVKVPLKAKLDAIQDVVSKLKKFH